jgi:hypothetical protein
MSGETLPSGGGTLPTLEFEPVNGGVEISLSEKVFGDADGNEMVSSGPIPVVVPPCSNIDNDGQCDVADQWPDCFDDGTYPYDECNVCNGPGIPEGECDCEGHVEDCAGDCGGDATLDNCGTCDVDPLNDCVPDCAGIWGGDAEEDSCGVCSGGESGHEANSDMDDCGDCFGYNEAKDECGVCDGDNGSCVDCGGVPNGNAYLDNCSNCVGGDTDLEACVPDCSDEAINCDGTWFEGQCWGGSAEIDECGICDGNYYQTNGSFCGGSGDEPNNCCDCAGIPYGDNELHCGTCDTDPSNDCVQDCWGTLGGTAIVDSCGVCSDGETGLVPNANMDSCGECYVGGSANDGWNTTCEDCVPSIIC